MRSDSQWNSARRGEMQSLMDFFASNPIGRWEDIIRASDLLKSLAEEVEAEAIRRKLRPDPIPDYQLTSRHRKGKVDMGLVSLILLFAGLIGASDWIGASCAEWEHAEWAARLGE